MKTITPFFLIWISVLHFGCTTKVVIPNHLKNHIICIDENGKQPVYLDESENESPEQDQIEMVVKGFRSHVFEKNRQPTITLFLHGGLVNLDSAIKGSKNVFNVYGKDKKNQENFYPVFINWNTGIRSSIWAHYLEVRGGVSNSFYALLTLPFIVVADIGRGIAKTPITLFKEFTESPFIPSFSEESQKNDQKRIAGWGHIQDLNPDPDLYENKTHTSILTKMYRALTAPTLFVSIPILETAGPGAYNNMLRRAQVLFQTDEDIKATYFKETGILSELMRELRTIEQDLKNVEVPNDKREEWDDEGRNRDIDIITQLRTLQNSRQSLDPNIRQDKERYQELTKDIQLLSNLLDSSDLTNAPEIPVRLNPKNYSTKRFKSVVKVKIVAHSMGTIVANELLRRNSDMYFSEVSYIGAACTLKDFSDLAIPYLVSNPTTQFYCETLHPSAEVNEWTIPYALGVMPRGSLLEWIDKFLTEPKSKMDYTLGKWQNVSNALPQLHFMERDVRERLNIQCFSLDGSDPLKHGQLNDVPRKEGSKKYWEIYRKPEG